jgi:DNA-binding CsgD family transcriptional regulator
VTDELVHLADVQHLDGPGEPGIFDWRQLRIEALVRLGRLDAAEGELAALEELAVLREHRPTVAAAARVRGLLAAARGRRGPAEAAFATALELVRESRLPFEEARVSLDWGTSLRRWGSSWAATRRLRDAAQLFAGLGALPFQRQAQAQLGPSGRTGGGLTAPLRSTLRPQELAIAKLVADGLTNREIAGELVLSVKTVEFHLTQIYRRHGLRSRTELVARLAGEPST